MTKKASLVSMDADGFTLNFTTVANANAAQVYSLALFNVNVKAGNFIKTTSGAPVSQAITGTGFAPKAVFFHSFQDVTQANPVAQFPHELRRLRWRDASKFGVRGSQCRQPDELPGQ